MSRMDNGDAWSFFKSKKNISDGWLTSLEVRGRARGHTLNPGPHVLARSGNAAVIRLGHKIPETVGELSRAYEHVEIYCTQTSWILPDMSTADFEPITLFNS